jgi:hypothetical protein
MTFVGEFIVGSLVTPEGARPFAMHLPTGVVELNVYDPQAAVLELDAVQRRQIEERLRAVLEFPVQEIRLEEYRCGVCGEWVQATRAAWSLSICLSCSLDRDSELWEYYKGEDGS